MNGKIFTLRNLYQSGTEKLEKAGIREAKLDAWYLLEYKTGISRAVFLADPDREVEEEKAESYQKDICTRARRIPLQHITGSQEFMGYEFLVNEHVLIPRQDTENLVEEALKVIRPDMHVLDMCTGSGCIPISLLKYAAERKHITGGKAVGADISADALEVAKKNAQRLKVPVIWVQSDIFENVSESFDLIVSNPPYIRTEVIQGLEDEVKLHDPWIALDGHEDGLYFYRRIVSESISHLNDGAWLMFEIGHDQAEDVSKLMKNAGFCNIYVKKDLAGLDRVVCGMYNKRVVENSSRTKM